MVKKNGLDPRARLGMKISRKLEFLFSEFFRFLFETIFNSRSSHISSIRVGRRERCKWRVQTNLHSGEKITVMKKINKEDVGQ